MPKNLPRSTRQTVLVFEADRAVARQIQACLEAAGFHVPRPCATPQDALASSTSAPPDLVIMDLALLNDAPFTRAFMDAVAARQVPMVYLVALADRASLERAANNRAAGCLVRPLTDRQLVSEALLATITAARRPATRAELPSAMTPDEKLRLIAAVVGDLPLADPLDASRDSRAEPGNGGDRQSSLSARERQIVELLANGARVVTIAQRLQLSPHTVRNHLKSVFRKLNLHGQHELFEYWNAHAS